MLFFYGRRDMDPVRRELGIVRLLEAEANVKRSTGVAALAGNIREGDSFDGGALNNIGLKAALIQFLADLPQRSVQGPLSATGVGPDFSVTNSLYFWRST